MHYEQHTDSSMLVSLNRLSPILATNFAEKTVWWLYRRLNVIRVGLNNAATSRILDNPAVIPIRKQLQLFISVYFCVNISLIFNSFYNTVLSDKRYPSLSLLLLIRPENQSAYLWYTL